ncbi:alternate-type signal peptide domain-containing protein [Leucobacter sp. USHLN154]|uniref:alternate-type signal peptide domain-containing protein n=1 Tax=Leucobacter sp. USHLN154 TaxID=3081269 RepID=UPI003016A4D8
MTSTTTPTTRNRRITGVLAIGAGAALLLGGSTFALWSANANVAGGTVTAGNLEVSVADGSWNDVSAEHTTPVAIPALADFRIIPGDVLEGTFPVDVAALGDNFAADLTVGFTSPSGALLADLEGVTVTYSILDADGNVVGAGDTVSVLSEDSVVVDPAAIVVDNLLDGSAPELTAVVTATFDADTPDQVRTATEALLGDLDVTVSQKRA